MIRETKEELDHMERTGVIEKVTEPTDLVLNLVYARKQSGKLRICLDPRDLNKAIKRPHYPTKTIEDISYKLKGAKIFSTTRRTTRILGNKHRLRIQLENDIQQPARKIPIQKITIQLVAKPGCVPTEDGHDH